AEALGVRARVDDDLREPDFGLWQGLTEEELAHRHKDAFRAFLRDARAVVPPEAEEIDLARERLGRALQTIQRASRRDGRLVVVVAGELAFPILAAACEGKEAPRDLWAARRRDDVRSFELETGGT